MYATMILGFMVILPIASAIVELVLGQNWNNAPFVFGEWFVFWGIGVRLFTAGLRQAFKPGLTATEILGIKDKAAWQVIRELGFANLAVSTVALMSLFIPAWSLPAAIAGAIFMGLAGLEHFSKKNRSREENIALISDLFIALAMVVYIMLILTT